MKVLVIGGGGREHALCWKLSQSSLVEDIHCAPGNAGIAKVAKCEDISVNDIEALAKFAEANRIELTVVGPELPLCLGVKDVFASRSLKVFGPSEEAARLEGSKIFAKEFMMRYGIPTASAVFFRDESSATEYIRKNYSSSGGFVVKADGLAAGKGVVVADTQEEAIRAVQMCFGGEFGEAGKKILIEERLIGEEVSIIAFCDGETIVPLASSQDHKRAYEGDNGPNTGGMGAYSPAPIADEILMKKVKEKVLDRFLCGIRKERLDYKGVIYAGIMVCDGEPYVLEFNVRFGDPETQAILPRMKGDLAEIMLKVCEGKLASAFIDWEKKSSVCVVMAAGGYPGKYEKGHVIEGIEDAEASGGIVFHAGTAFDKTGRIVSAGGRVLSVVSTGDDISEAVKSCYKAVGKISWKGAFYRKDIAYKALR